MCYHNHRDNQFHSAHVSAKASGTGKCELATGLGVVAGWLFHQPSTKLPENQ